MTRKEYQLIANIIKSTFEYDEDYNGYYIASNLADAFQADNPRFDRDWFLEACDI